MPDQQNNHGIRMKTLNRISEVLICLLASTSLPHAAAQDDPFFEMPIVLSASRLEQPASETPVAVSIIDRQTIAASGARTIPEVLRLVPGFVVGNSVNEFGDEPKIVVAYHGHTDQYSKQMQVLIDGRSIYEPMLGGVAWNMLPINLEDIERIEVSRGPNAASYGANSFLAVINIITRQAIEDQGQMVKVDVGNHDIVDTTYRFGDSNGDLDYRVTLSTQDDNGQDRADGIDNHDDLAARAVDYRMDYQIDSRSQLTYQGGYGRTRIQADQNYASLGIKPVRETANINSYQFLKYEKNFSNKNTLVLQYYYNRLDKNDSSVSKVIDPADFGVPADPFTLNLNFDIKSERHNLEATDYMQINDDLRLIWGLSGQKDLGKAPYFLGNEDTIIRKTYRGFSNVEWHVSQNDILNFGILIEKSNTIGTANSPRVAYIHKFSPQHSLRLSISKAIRSPFIIEEHGDLFLSHELTVGGTPTGITIFDQQEGPGQDLENEEILSRDIGYYGRFFNNDLLFNARIFRDTLSKLIRPQKTPIPYDNLDDVTHILINDNSTIATGIETELDYFADPTLRIIASASYLDIDANDPIYNGGSESLEKSAPHRAASLLAIKQFSEKYSGSAGYYYVGEFSWIDASSSNSNNYRTLDLKFSRNMHLNGDKASASIVLKNLLGDYSNYDNEPDAGPRIVQTLTAYLELKIQFR
jgi:iron complex outermembrane receptor protein